MIKKLLGFGLAAVMLTACNETNTQGGDQPAGGGDEQTSAVEDGVPAGSDWAVFTEADMPIRMRVPDTDSDAIQLVQKTLQPYEQEVHCGVVKVVVSEAYGDDITILKDDLANDGMYKCTVLTEEPGLVIYKQETPDGLHTFHHFMFVKEIGGIEYLVKSILTDEEYSHKSIEKMVKFVKTLEAAPAA